MAYYNKEMEGIEPSELKKLQGKRLYDTVLRVYQNVPYYAKKMIDAGVTPEDIKSIDDI